MASTSLHTRRRLMIPGCVLALGLGTLIACEAQRPTLTDPVEGAYPATYSHQQIVFDFGIFRAALEEAHPGLYRYRSEEEMDAVFDDAASRLDSVHNEGDFYRLLGSVIAAIGDGHTRRMPWPRHSPLSCAGAELFIVGLDNPQPRVLDTRPVRGTWFDWSPDGRWLVYGMAGQDDENFMLYNPEADVQRELVIGQRGEKIQALFSSDGREVLVKNTDVTESGHWAVGLQGGPAPRESNVWIADLVEGSQR